MCHKNVGVHSEDQQILLQWEEESRREREKEREKERKCAGRVNIVNAKYYKFPVLLKGSHPFNTFISADHASQKARKLK